MRLILLNCTFACNLLVLCAVIANLTSLQPVFMSIQLDRIINTHYERPVKGIFVHTFV